MGWKGTLRSVRAAAREAERNARRRQSEYEKRQKEHARVVALEQAEREVTGYQSYLQRLVTLHQEGREPVDWQAMAALSMLPEARRSTAAEEEARTALDAYRPSLLDKLLRRVETRKAALEAAVVEGRAQDESEYQRAVTRHDAERSERERRRKLAERVLREEPEALHQAVRELAPFSALDAIGSAVEIRFAEGASVHAILSVHGREVVPMTAKSLLQSGRLSEKPLPKTAFNELYQDHVCSAVLRVAREILAVLPVPIVVVTAQDEMLDSSTGHLAEQPILSVAIPRRSLFRLDLQRIDPSESMQNFVHRTSFSKTKGFAPVEAIDPREIQSAF